MATRHCRSLFLEFLGSQQLKKFDPLAFDQFSHLATELKSFGWQSVPLPSRGFQ